MTKAEDRQRMYNNAELRQLRKRKCLTRSEWELACEWLTVGLVLGMILMWGLMNI